MHHMYMSRFSKSERMLTQNIPCKERIILMYGMTYRPCKERTILMYGMTYRTFYRSDLVLDK